MGCVLLLSCRQELDISGGVTESIFPEIEQLFNDNPDLYNALLLVSPPTAGDDYRSVMDWLYCAVQPERKEACRAFYDMHGPPLREIVSDLDLLKAQVRILVLLAEAYSDFNHQRERRWIKRHWCHLCRFARAAA